MLRIPLFIFVLALSTSALAQGQEATPPDLPQQGAFDRNFALGVYGNAWGVGDYDGGGIGFRARWEPFRRLGIDVFSEHMLVSHPNAVRHDHPIGFNLYIPINLARWLRIRPMIGACAVFSFVDSDVARSAPANNVSFGVHGGVGVELALGSRFSLFFDTQAIAYISNTREEGGWIGSITGNLGGTWTLQGSLGLQVHL